MTLFPRASLASLLPVVLLLVLTAFLPCPVLAAVEPEEPPRWSLDVKGGYFYPAIEDWATYYGDNKTWQIGGSMAYKLLRQVEVGLEGGIIKDRGQAYAPVNGIVTGSVDYELYPASVFIVLRGIFSEDQWLVPYIGGGFTRMFYREKIEDQGTVKGSTDGYYGKAGIQLQLDGADRSAANNLYLNYGINHTWLFFEAQRITAKINDNDGNQVDLGGTSYLWGLLFEF